MAQLRQDHQKFLDRDAAVVVVGPEDAAAFKTYWLKENLPFTGLPDPELVVLNLYEQEVNLFKLGRMPAQIIIDKSGVARHAHYANWMSDIPGNDELLRLLDELNVTSA
jgi:peroxiredoxin Q/BCP